MRFKKSISVKTLAVILCLTFLMTGFTGITGAAETSRAPGSPTLFILNDGQGGTNFTVGFNIWFGEAASQWKLYEDDKLIFSESLSSANKASYEVNNKTYGVYKYRVEVSNSGGTVSSGEKYHVVGGASKIVIPKGDMDKQAFQITVGQSTTDFEIMHIEKPNATFSIATNNPSVADMSIVNGNTLRIKGLQAGRTSIKITETSSGDERLVGVRVKTADGKLPGMPNYLAIGSVMTDTVEDLNFFSDYQPGDQNKRMDIRYIYINGEPDAWDRGADGWQKWGNAKGDRAIRYIRNSMKRGMIPFFVYYTICGAHESYQQDKGNIQSPVYLSYYFKDLKFLLDIIEEEAAGDMVGMVLEPDFLGYMMQNSPESPSEMFANTKLAYEKAYGGENATGILNSTIDVDPDTGKPFANTLEGLVKCINYTIRKFGSNVYFGWQFNTWANPAPGVPAKGLMRKTDEVGIEQGRAFIREKAAETAQYYMSAGILSSGANFVSIDKYGQDAVAKEPSAANDPAGSIWFWNADHWNNYLEYVKVLNQNTKLPVVLWQMPVGHIERSQAADPYDGGLFDRLDNTLAFEDSTASYFFGDTFIPGAGNRLNYFKTNKGNDPLISDNGSGTVTWGSHFEAARDAGVVAALFGAGVGKATHGNCNDTTNSKKPDDDMWFVVKAQRYFKNPVPVDGSVIIPTTPTPTVTPTPTPTVTFQTPKRFTLSGSVKPDFNYSAGAEAQLKSGFKVQLRAYAMSSPYKEFEATTGADGSFEFKGLESEFYDSPLTSGHKVTYQMTITKPNYLERNVGVNSNLVNGATLVFEPIGMWAGDMVRGGVQDGAINMSDIMEIVRYFNSAKGDGKYVEGSDLNKDNAINMTDIMIVIRNFNKTSANYPEAQSKVVPPGTTPTPIVTPTATPKVTPTPTPKVTPTPTNGTIQPWSANSVNYQVGARVSYKGQTYECTYAHTSNAGWAPDMAFTLWKKV